MLFICSCAAAPIKDKPEDNSKQNIRTLKILIMMQEASKRMERDVGLRLQVAGIKKIKFETRDPAAMVAHMRRLTAGEHFDLAVAVVPRVGSVGEAVVGALAGGWQGYIDDDDRRFVIVKGVDPWVLTHEIYHSFLLSHDHSSGQMSALRLCFLPYGYG